MKSRSYIYGGLTTTLNILLNGLTLGRYLWLEGRVTHGRFRNWARRFGYQPLNFVKPKSEEELVSVIKESVKIRLFGAGHSFNEGIHSDGTLVSLDDYAGIISEDPGAKQLTVKAGTRVRDVIRLLKDRGLAFRALPSHNAQSIGGILATDVHGTGKDWGWVSELVVSLRVIDGNGEIHDCKPGDDMFSAAIGGIGAIGIISTVTVQARERFNVEQTCVMADLRDVENRLEDLIDENDHVSLYVFPFSTQCQINIWNRTDKRQSFLGPLREFLNISLDALTSSWFGNLMAYAGVLERWSPLAYRFKRGSDLVLESDEAYSRTIYHLHQELEFTVPFENGIEAIRLFLQTFEEMCRHNPRELPYTLLEVRFTPAGHELALIGPGRDHRSLWIDLICNDSHGFEKYYLKAEELIRQLGARPHLGKFCQTLDKQHLSQIYGEHFEHFLELRDKHDPQRKFENPFTRRLFGE
jgi:FAD/FMN-containing dehydrogenase